MIRSTTFEFLKELSENNNREWFALNKERHDAARANVLEFVSEVIRQLSDTDPMIPADLDAKDCVMRIYRDIRFSTDKTPYKTNFGAGISPNGKNFNGPGYYLHISPNECFIAGGSWYPEAKQLKAIRQEIDYNGSEFREILSEPAFTSYFSNLDTEHSLKTTPKGYAADHPDIEYLKLKSFTASHQLDATELMKKDSPRKVAGGFALLHPFIVFLRNAIDH